MPELMTESVAEKHREQKIETRSAAKRIAAFIISATASVALAFLVASVVSAQDKYSLKSPSGIAFSDFRGYEDWSLVSSARTDEVLKVIVANPKMIKAYKSGVPGNGQPFPEGSMMLRLRLILRAIRAVMLIVDERPGTSRYFWARGLLMFTSSMGRHTCST